MKWGVLGIEGQGGAMRLTTWREGGRFEDWTEVEGEPNSFNCAKHYGDHDYDSAGMETLDPDEMTDSLLINLINAAIKWHVRILG